MGRSTSKIESVGTSPGSYEGGGDPKIWRAQQNTRDFYKSITRKYNSPMELKWIVTQTFASRSDLKKELKKIDEYASGTDIVIPGAVDEKGNRQFFSDPYQDPKYIRGLINRLFEQWNELSQEYDGASKVSMRDYMLRETTFEFDLFSSDFYLNWAGEGRLLVITGPLGSGKTDLSGKLAEMAINDMGWRVFGNYEMHYDIPGYDYCSKFSRLVKKVCESKMVEKTSVMITDEAGLDFPSYEASTRGFKEFDKFMKLTRKFKTNHIFIIQYGTQVPWILRKNYSAWMHKYKKKVVRYELRVGSRAYKDILINKVPRTELPFDTDYIAGMDMDIEVREMLDFLDDLPPRSNQFSEINAWINRRIEKRDQELTPHEKKRIALKLMEVKDTLGKDAKLTTTTIADAIESGESTVRKWHKDQKRRDGKSHRKMTVQDVEDVSELVFNSDEDPES